MSDVPWGLVAPIIVVQLILIVVALRDLIHRDRVAGPKWVWAAVIVLFGIIGPAVYFTVGRRVD